MTFEISHKIGDVVRLIGKTDPRETVYQIIKARHHLSPQFPYSLVEYVHRKRLPGTWQDYQLIKVDRTIEPEYYL